MLGQQPSVRNQLPLAFGHAPQVVTLEALLKQGSEEAPGGGAGGAGGAGSRGAQGLTYVTASGGRLWSSALRMDSQRAEGASERTVRCAGGASRGAGAGIG